MLNERRYNILFIYRNGKEVCTGLPPQEVTNRGGFWIRIQRDYDPKEDRIFKFPEDKSLMDLVERIHDQARSEEEAGNVYAVYQLRQIIAQVRAGSFIERCPLARARK